MSRNILECGKKLQKFNFAKKSDILAQFSLLTPSQFSFNIHLFSRSINSMVDLAQLSGPCGSMAELKFFTFIVAYKWAQ
jgi:hypothetical protein